MPDPYGDPVLNGIMDNCQGHTAGITTFTHESAMLYPEWALATPCTTPYQHQRSIAHTRMGWTAFPSRLYGCVDAECTQVTELLSSWDNTSIQLGTEGCTDSTNCTSFEGVDINGNPVTTRRVCGLTMKSGVPVTACAAKDYAWQNNSWQRKDDPEYLDECNGRVQPDGTYGYHITSTFPYTLGCYMGTPTAGNGNNGGGMFWWRQTAPSIVNRGQE